MKKTVFTILTVIVFFSLNSLAQKTWTGSTSTAWATSTNWNPVGVPTAGDNVVIPSGTTNSPTVSGATGGVCNNLTLNSGATLSITGTSGSSTVLTVGGTATLNGALSIGGHFLGNTGKLVAGNVVWNSTSSINGYFGGRMEVSGNYTFASGSSINLGLCWMTFTGGSNSNIFNHSASSSFSSLTLSKTSGASVYIDASSTATMTIDGLLNIGTGSVLIGQPNITTILKGNLINSGNIYLNSGTLSLEKASGTQDIQINTNDYINSLRINTGGTVTLTTTYYLQLKGSMTIQAGVLDPQDNTIALFGDWSNTVGTTGFEEGIGRVIFNGGNYHQYSSNETFFTLEVHKTIGGALRVNGTDVTCEKYDWTAGAIDVLNNGTFTVSNQLLDNGIAGNFYLNAGCTINLTNLTGNVDLKGNLYIYGGNFNVYGGVNPSWWPSGGNASITMSGGTLDFIDQGMLIKTDATYSFSHNITGGTIRTSGNFACTRSDFNPTAGLIEMTGSNNVLLSMTAGSLYNVTINKQTTNTVTLSTDATINGLLLMDEGIFQMNNKVLTTTGNIAVNAGGTFWLDLNAQLKIANNKNITVYSGGLLKVIGTTGNEPVITRNGSTGNYIIHVNSGATIAASRSSFYYVNPLRVFSGATIDPLHPFHYCKFRYTSTGMLRIDNSQDLLIRNVEFLGPATGYNVYKSVNSGSLNFKDAYGDYSGPTYEDDFYNRISWTVTQPGLWTGAVSSSWYNADNWDDFTVPVAGTNVTIPSAATNMPVLDAGNWECNNLTVNGTITFAGANLTVNGNLTMNGLLAMNNASSQFTVVGDVAWNSGSTASITADAAILVNGHWNFNAGSNAQINNGRVYFQGTSSKWIRCYSATSDFYSVYVTKTGGAQAGFSDLSTQPMVIKGELRIFANGKFVSDSYEDVILHGNLTNDGTLQCSEGAFKLDGATQSLKPNTSDYFNHLVFSQTATASINTANTSVINVKGNLHIDSGVFNAGSCTINIEGDWDNNVGPAAFTEGGSRVVFKGGNYHQYIFQDEDFATLEVNKSLGGALRIQTNAIVNVSAYDWTAGAVDMISGSFTATTLLDNGIAGSFYVNAGTTVTLGNMSGFPHLNGNLFISGGTMNIIAPIESQWPGNDNASITMSGGELNVYPYGIEIINNPPYTFTTNITAGTIRTEGAFINHRSDFNPAGGTLELYGSNNTSITMNAGSLRGVTINKPTDKTVTLATNATVNDLLTIQSGTLHVNNKVLTTGGNIAINNGGTLWMDMNSQLKIAPNKFLDVNTGGLLKTIGADGNEVVFTINGTGNYFIYINGSGTISARRTSFYYVNPINVGTSAVIDPANPFDFCKFRYCVTKMLNVLNGQDLTIHNVEFLTPAAGNNVSKPNDLGSLTFKDASGDFSGQDFENDPYNCIHWTYTQPGLWTGTVSTNWYTGDNWDDGLVPNPSTNVTIPLSAPYMPILNAGIGECNNLTINGTLTIAGANLTANGNMIVNGTLAMNSAADQLTILGDVAWESGSQANITADAAILVNGHWNFNAGSNAQLNNGKVYFQGTSSKWIRNYSETSSFNHLYVTKTSGAQIGFSDLSTESLQIWGDLRVFANGKFVSDAVAEEAYVLLLGDLISDGTTQCSAGTLLLSGGDQLIKPNTNDYFNHLHFWQTGTVTINTTNTSILNVKGKLYIGGSGVFNAGNSIIKVGGAWENWGGTDFFIEGTSRVIFNGENNDQTCINDETFYTLEVDKPLGGALKLAHYSAGSTVVCSEYDWTAGTLDAMNGHFTAHNLLDNGIAGDFYVTDGGSINLGNMSGIPHLKGNLHINGGTFNIIAPIGSEWGGHGDASITMTDGELNVYPYGIEIMDDPSYTFTANITGGTIRTEGAFINNRADFNPSGGTLELHGTQDAGLLMNGGGLYGLTINKSAGKSVILSNDATVNGPLYVNDGTLLADGHVLTTAQNVVVQTGGILRMDENSQLKIGSSQSLSVFSGSTLRIEGSSGNEAVVTRNGASGNYVINITSGAMIAAKHASFYYVDPLRIHYGAIIEDTYPFHYCKFRYANFGMLRIDNDQNLLLRNVEFLGPATGYNVYKSVDSGNLEFKDYYGDYAGAAYENDPFNRINWTVTQPGLWTGAVSTNWYTADNWDDLSIPTTGTDVMIPATAPYMPVIDAGIWEINNLTINGTLTIAGANLTANGNMTVNGTLAMNSAADQLTILGDVAWESGSQANITADAAIQVYGNWNFNDAADVQLEFGSVIFKGNHNKWIRCYSNLCKFNNLYIQKTGDAFIGSSDLSTCSMFINGDFKLWPGAHFIVDSQWGKLVKGDILNDGTIVYNDGGLHFIGVDQVFKPNINDVYSYVSFSQSGVVSINTANTNTIDLYFVTINSGIFDAGNCTLKIRAGWLNHAGPNAFNEGGSRVIFKGSNTLNQIYKSENFAILEVDIPSYRLEIIDNAEVFCSSYDWTSGGVEVIEGTFTAQTLIDNAIKGDFVANSGTTINLGSYGGFTQLEGNLTNLGGTINIPAAINSQWPGNGNASITMSGGELNVYPYGIEIVNNPSYSFTTNITGGKIRTEGSFINHRADFNPAGGTLELYGNENSSLVMNAGSLHGLFISKSPDKTATLATNATVNWTLTVQSGILQVNNKTLTTFQNIAVNQGGTLWMDLNSQLKISSGKTMNVNDGGLLKVIGTESNEPVITNNGSGYYDIWVNSGGTIAASRASFYYVNPVVVGSLGFVDPLYDFDYCKFRYSTVEMLRVENSQDLVITNAEFLKPAIGYNVAKMNNWGSVSFNDSYGDHSGSAFENDPYNRIHWISGVNYVNAKIFLEGPYNGTDMNALLEVSNGFPLSQPYHTAPWNYNGTEFVNSVPVDVVDWVLVEFRDAPTAAQANAATTFKRMAAFLKKNGSIVGMDGISMPEFDHTLNHQLFLVVMHRNHLGVMSSVPLQPSGDTYTYDFTTGTGKAYGGTMGYKLHAFGNAVMVAGDANADGAVSPLDKTNHWAPQAGKKGYLQTDFNMDKQVDNKDKNLYWMPNFLGGYSIQVP